MGKDKRGIDRGSCGKCDCKEYEVFDKRLLCDYCGHRPMDHEIKTLLTRSKRLTSSKQEAVSPPAKRQRQDKDEAKERPKVQVKPAMRRSEKHAADVSSDPSTPTRRSHRVRSKSEATDTATETEEAPTTDQMGQKVTDRKRSASKIESANETVPETGPEEKEAAKRSEKPLTPKKDGGQSSKKNEKTTEREEAVVEIELDSDGVLAAPLKEGRAQQELEVTVVQRRRSRRSNAGNRMMSLVKRERGSSDDESEEGEKQEASDPTASEEEEEEVQAESLDETGEEDGGEGSRGGADERSSGAKKSASGEGATSPVLPHRCAQCGKRFKLLNNLIQHRKEHVQQSYRQRRFICGLCEARFSKQGDLSRHLAFHDQTPPPNKCDDCGKEFKDETTLRMHRQSIHEGHNARYICGACNKVFTRRHDLKRHQDSIHRDYRYKCGVCGLAYKTPRTLRNHEVLHAKSHSEDVSVDAESEPEASEGDTAPEKSAVVVAKKPEGEKVYALKKHLRQHILAHAGLFQFKCELCGQGFYKLKTLREHSAAAHGDPESSSFSCTECCCSFSTEVELLKHGEWHGSLEQRVIISNARLVQLIQRLDRSTAEDFINSKHFWVDAAGPSKDKHLHEAVNDDGPTRTRDAPRTQDGSFMVEGSSGEVEIRIQLDSPDETSKVPAEAAEDETAASDEVVTVVHDEEDLTEEQTYKLLFGEVKSDPEHKPFQCRVCLKTFSEKMYSRCHVKAHVGEFRHQCSQCGLGFLKSSDLARHRNRCGNKRQRLQETRVCEDCELLFDNEVEYTQHRQDVCAQLLQSRAAQKTDGTEVAVETVLSELRKEVGEHPERFIHVSEEGGKAGKAMRMCTETGCGQQFSSRPLLKQHLRHEHGVILPPIFTKKARSAGYAAAHPKEGLLCVQCGERFTSPTQYTDHKSTIHGEKQFSCSVCGKCFGRKFDCQRHEENVHFDKHVTQCDICGRQCKDKYTVEAHKKTVHQNIRMHVCPVCSHKFSHKSNLTQHMRTHTHEKPYQCSECLKWFSTRQYRDLHLKVHSGIQPHKCKYCGRAFSHKGSLRYHERTHEDDRPYHCYSCHRRFRDPGKRMKHARVCQAQAQQQTLIVTRPTETQGGRVQLLQGQGEVLVAAPGQAAAAVLAQAQVAHGEDHVTVELDPAIYDSLVPCDQPDEQQTTHVQIEHDGTIEAAAVQQIEQLIQDNQIQLDGDGGSTEIQIVMDPENSAEAETVYLVVSAESSQQ